MVSRFPKTFGDNLERGTIEPILGRRSWEPYTFEVGTWEPWNPDVYYVYCLMCSIRSLGPNFDESNLKSEQFGQDFVSGYEERDEKRQTTAEHLSPNFSLKHSFITSLKLS